MLNEPLFLLLVEDLLGLNFAWLPQEVHDEEGTQRSEEPVSKTILKLCAGVPMLTVPVHSRSSSWSVSGTLARFWRDSGMVAMGLISAPSAKA